MLDMGFADDIDAIVGRTPENRQTLMFSATLAGRIGDLAAEMLNNPVRISIAQKQMEYDKIEQRIHFVDDINHKQRMLEHLLTMKMSNKLLYLQQLKPKPIYWRVIYVTLASPPVLCTVI